MRNLKANFILRKMVRLAVLTSFFVSLLSPYNYATFMFPEMDCKDLFIDSKYGKIVESFQGNKNLQIFCIQDLHNEPSVQKNIEEIVKTLNQRYEKDISIIGVEGSWEEIDTSVIGSIPDPALKNAVVNSLFNKGDLSGVELFSINNNNNVKIYGLENKDVYLENFKVLYKSLKEAQTLGVILYNIKNAINQAKLYLYTKEIREIELEEQKYTTGKISLEEFVKYLKQELEKYRIYQLAKYDIFREYLNIIELKNNINFLMIKSEAMLVLNSLKNRISNKEYLMLVELAKSAPQDYYTYLNKIIVKNNIRISGQIDNILRYFDYLERTKSFKEENFLHMIKEAVFNVKMKIASNGSDRQKLIYLDYYFGLLEDYLNNKAIKSQVLDYKSNKQTFYEILDYLMPKLDKENLEFLKQAEQNMDEFYRLAFKRDEILVQNLTKLTTEQKQNTAIMFFGGFHAEGITDILRAKDVSYQVIKPVINTNNLKEIYLKKIEEQAKFLGIGQESVLSEYDINNFDSLALMSAFQNGELDQEAFKLLADTLMKMYYKDKDYEEKISQILKTFEQNLNISHPKTEIAFEIEKDEDDEDLLRISAFLGKKKKIITYSKRRFEREQGKQKVDELAEKLSDAVAFALREKDVRDISYTVYSPRRTMSHTENSHFKIGSKRENEGISYDVGNFEGAILDVKLVLNQTVSKEELENLILKANTEVLDNIFGIDTISRGGRIKGTYQAIINQNSIKIIKLKTGGVLVSFKVLFDPEKIELRQEIDKVVKRDVARSVDRPKLGDLDVVEGLVSDVREHHLATKLKVGVNGARGRIGVNLFRHMWRNPNFELTQVVVNDGSLQKGFGEQKRLLELWFFDEILGSLIPNAVKSALFIQDGAVFNNIRIDRDRFIRENNIIMKNSENNLFIIQSEDKKARSKILYTIEFFRDNSRVIIRDSDNNIVMNIKIVARQEDPRAVKWEEEQLDERLDVVFEASGRFKKYEQVSGHLGVNTDLVILTDHGDGPEWDRRTFVYGVNTAVLRERLDETSVISMGASTINALAGPVKVLNDIFGVSGISFTALRSVSKQDSVGDVMAFSPRLLESKAKKALPFLGISGGFEGDGDVIRANTPNGSVVSLTAILDKPIQSAEELNEMLRECSRKMNGLMVVDGSVETSNQVIGREGAQIINPKCTQVENFVGADGKVHSRISLQIWYDNEGQYTQQLLRTALEYRLEKIRRAEIRKERILAEQRQVGSGGFKDTTIFSDLHGEGGKMFDLMFNRLGLKDVGDVAERLARVKAEYAEFLKTKPKEEDKSKKLIAMLRREFFGITYESLIRQKHNIQSMSDDDFKKFMKKQYGYIKMYFNGDIGDRGPHAIWVYRQLEELQNLGLLSFSAIGNHDIWLFMNLMGWHLPIREENGELDYNLYDRTISREMFRKKFPDRSQRRWLATTGLLEFSEGEVRLLTNNLEEITNKLKENPFGLTVENVLAGFYTFTQKERRRILDMAGKTFEERKLFWARKLHEYNCMQDARQKRKDVKLKGGDEPVSYADVAKRVGELFDKVKLSLPKESLEDKLWNDLRGVYFGTDVNAGFKGVGRMSLRWWEEHLDAIKSLMPSQKTSKKEILDAWEELQDYVEQVVKILKIEYDEKTTKAIDDERLIYQVFQSIFYRNYESPEWLALDLSWHSGWGPLFMADETDRIKDELKDDFDPERDTITGANYFQNENFIRMGEFIRANFKLFEITETRDLMMHGILPVITYKEDGQEKHTFGFTYRGVFYRGKNIFEGMRIIEEDIRNVRNLREAFNLVNSWYADKTTIAKPVHVEKMMPHLEEILDSLGIEGRLYLGHVPYLEKIYARNIGLSVINPRLVFTDDSMSSGYLFSGGCRVSDLNRSYAGFVNQFGEEKAKQYVEKKQGMFGEYIVLKQILGIPQEIKDWFKKRPALAVFGFASRDSIEPVLNPKIVPVDKAGKKLPLGDGVVVELLDDVQGSLKIKVSEGIFKEIKISVEKGAKIKVSKAKTIRLPKGAKIKIDDKEETLKEDIVIDVAVLPRVRLKDETEVDLGLAISYDTSRYAVDRNEYFGVALRRESQSFVNLGRVLSKISFRINRVQSSLERWFDECLAKHQGLFVMFAEVFKLVDGFFSREDSSLNYSNMSFERAREILSAV